MEANGDQEENDQDVPMAEPASTSRTSTKPNARHTKRQVTELTRMLESMELRAQQSDVKGRKQSRDRIERMIIHPEPQWNMVIMGDTMGSILAWHPTTW